MSSWSDLRPRRALAAAVAAAAAAAVAAAEAEDREPALVVAVDIVTGVDEDEIGSTLGPGDGDCVEIGGKNQKKGHVWGKENTHKIREWFCIVFFSINIVDGNK